MDDSTGATDGNNGGEDADNDSDSGNLSGVLSALSSISEKISELSTSITQGIIDGMKTLFVPEKGFLDDSVESLKTKLAEKFNVATYTELMKAIESHVEGQLDFGGYIDISLWDKHMPTIKNFLRGFFYPFVFLGGYNFVIWLLRGTKITGSGTPALWE